MTTTEENLARATGIDQEPVGYIFYWIKEGIIFEDEAIALLKRKGLTERAARMLYGRFFRWKNFKKVVHDKVRRMKR